jgi:hypothetical protein
MVIFLIQPMVGYLDLAMRPKGLRSRTHSSFRLPSYNLIMQSAGYLRAIASLRSFSAAAARAAAYAA